MRVKLAFSTLAAAFLVASLASCEKKTDCKLVIKTVDVAGMPLGNTAVRLYANVKTASGSTVEADLKAEGERHSDAMDVIELRAWVDSFVREVDAFAAQEAISNAPYLKQLIADRELSKQRMLHWLEHGSESNVSLIPEKNYLTDPIKKFWHEVRGIFS